MTFSRSDYYLLSLSAACLPKLRPFDMEAWRRTERGRR
jgi:hypothetical protein